MSLLDQYLLDQQSLDVDMPDVLVSPEEWTGFLQEVLETTVAAYLMLKQESTVRSGWEEDTFTINMERCMNLLTRKYKFPLRTQTQWLIYTPEMMTGEVSPQKAVKLDIKIWDKNWDNEDEIYFTWECKLIVDEARENKHKRLVPEYITNGIVRFLDPNWKYAQAVYDAGILGYVLYGKVAQIVGAINQEMLKFPQRPESAMKDVRARQANTQPEDYPPLICSSFAILALSMISSSTNLATVATSVIKIFACITSSSPSTLLHNVSLPCRGTRK